MSKRGIVNELHKNVQRNFKRRRVILKGLNDLFQADLVEMIPYAKENGGYKYILTVIDAFSKRAWAVPVKSKSGNDVTTAMSIVFQNKTIPKNLQTDNGKEFYNKEFSSLMKKYHVNHYSTYSVIKAGIVERFNRTLKSMMWKEFSFQGSYKWIDILDNLILKYNNTKHRTTGLKPIAVTEKHENKLLNTIYNRIKIAAAARYKVGQFVRISKYKSIFEKGYHPSWTTEIFKIVKIQSTAPITYLLQDENGQDIAGGFYEHEIQRTKYPGIYLIEKILRKNKNRYYVKWLGFNDTFNSYINKQDLL